MISLLIDYAYKYTVIKKFDIPKDLLESQKETIESNDETKIFLDDNMEYESNFKLLKMNWNIILYIKSLGSKG